MKAILILFLTQMVPTVVGYLKKKYLTVSARARRKKHEHEKKS